MDFVDRELMCVQCSKTFVFSAAEQQFFFHKGDSVTTRNAASNATHLAADGSELKPE